MRDLNVGINFGGEDIPVGRLVEKGSELWFQYDAEFLGRRLEISPFALRLRTGLYNVEARDLWGVFHDSLPDTFGRKALYRELAKRGLPTDSVLDMLAVQGSRAMGALTYCPNYDDPDPPPALELAILAQDAMALYGDSSAKVLEALVRAAGTAGGARPKVVVGRTPDGRLWPDGGVVPQEATRWLIKFTGEDPAYSGALEAAYMTLAKAAGIDVPEHEVLEAEGGERYFAVKRFDRDGVIRHHMHTFGGMAVRGSDNLVDYADLLGVTHLVTRDVEAVHECFRRMVFNVLVGNGDDHDRNFAFLMDAKGVWRVSPAYDMTWTPRKPMHTLLVAGKDRDITRADCAAVAEAVAIRKRDAEPLIEQVWAGVRSWLSVADQYALPGHVIDQVHATIMARAQLLLAGHRA